MKTIIYILTIFLFACGQNDDKTNFTSQNNFSFPFILDTLTTSNKSYKTSEMKTPINDVIYIGQASDTITLSKYDYYKNNIFLDFQEYGERTVAKLGLKLYTSNRQLLTIDLEKYSIPPPPTLLENSDDFEIDSVATAKKYNEWKQRPRNYIQAIPVIVHNPSKDTIYLDQQDGRVIMIQEAKDENGQWKPIEFWRYSWCGNSYGAVGLLPNSVALTKIIKYEGDFETDLRLKLKNGNEIIYSDSFKGKINKSQFDIPVSDDKNLSRKQDNKEYLDRIFLNK